MKKYIISLFSLLILLISCSSKINQYVKVEKYVQKRHGKWVEEYTDSDGVLIATGKYKLGEKVGVWRITFNNQLYQKDKIKKNITYTKVYHPNGKIIEKGQSRLDISENNRHWYYFGDWKYYNENGKLKYIKKYADGEKVDSISFMK